MSWRAIDAFPDKVATRCLSEFERLPKQGKPIVAKERAEWTILAGIVQVSSSDENSIKVVSLGTGVKCLPLTRISVHGDDVRDSHAEVIARRGFISYLAKQAKAALQNEESIFCKVEGGEGRHRLKVENITFHMYISQAPCGDASMTSLAESGDYKEDDTSSTRARKVPSIIVDNTFRRKKRKLDGDQVAEESPASPKDELYIQEKDSLLRRGRESFAELGILRTKPGRADSDPSLSMSCSDKLARWNVLGLQSALLASIIEPIFLSSIVIGDWHDEESMKRALYGRLEETEAFHAHTPDIYATKMQCPVSQTCLQQLYPSVQLMPSNNAISCVRGCEKAEVLVNGRKQGSAKTLKGPSPPKTRSRICSLSLFQQCRDLYYQYARATSTAIEESSLGTYYDFKMLAREYQGVKQALLSERFSDWVCKPQAYEAFDSEGNASLDQTNGNDGKNDELP
ncbi:hypothetical protein BZG36_02106 [Bifiguratus adelaidae]|uniref:A to I editase domain-containing protein n=1 Tax=Bifiguratus adelaidae TaxID=1938954 RepID=A0A261Y3C8_9FUNG|nr:hypothetical protein BZG36_02106 [Bifiguratus adelaidae]